MMFSDIMERHPLHCTLTDVNFVSRSPTIDH